MSIFRRSVPLLTLGLLSSLGVVATQAAVPNRILSIDGESSRVAVGHSVPARAQLATDMGQASGDETLTGVTLHFSLSDAQQADLTKLLQDQQNPASALYHQWLTPAQFGARFGVSSADMEKAKAWLQAQGLTVTAVAPSMNNVTVSGTIAQIDAAFGTVIHTLNENGVTHISNLSDPTLPAALANVVSGISGLSDFKPQSRASVSKVASVTAKYTSSISGNHYIAPGDLYTIYDVTPLLQNGITGSGISIAVAGQTDISTSDVAAFRSASGLTASTPTIVKATGYVSGTSSSDISEAQLDVEWSGAAAPGATINFVTVGTSKTTSVMDALVYAINNKTSPIITVSYGACEVNWGRSLLDTYNFYFQQANAQGITIVGPSGDSGATDCDYNVTTATGGLAVDFPASSPYVTAAGGTMFSEGTGSYWGASGATTNPNYQYQGSALSYIPEVVWNETDSSGLSATGGGASKYFTKPTWQVGTGVPSDGYRDVPDIALNSASSHDGYLFCVSSSCTNGYRDSSSNLSVVGGTSVASPVFAGMLALLEQELQSTGLGNVNGKIYGLANSTYYNNVFHDVTSGNNNSPCRTGSTNCASGGTIGFSANTGYDQTTGWGSIDAYNMVTKWNLASSTDGSGSTSTTTGDFAIAAGSSTVSIKSGSTGSVTLTLTPSNGFTGNVTLTAVGSSSSSGSLVATYSFSPSSPVTVNGTTTVTLSIVPTLSSAVTTSGNSKTVVAARDGDSVRHAWYGAGSGAVLACSLLLMVPRRRRWAGLVVALFSVSLLTMTGCSSGSGTLGSSSSSSSSSSTTTTTTSTSATYTVTVTGTSGTLIHTTTFSLTVTN